jgi:hypothetical protein
MLVRTGSPGHYQLGCNCLEFYQILQNPQSSERAAMPKLCHRVECGLDTRAHPPSWHRHSAVEVAGISLAPASARSQRPRERSAMKRAARAAAPFSISRY